MSEDHTFRCRVCREDVVFALEAPVRLRLRQLYEEPKVCAECRAHIVSVRKQISEAQMDPTQWAIASAKALDPLDPVTLLKYGRNEGDRVECPFCFSRGTHGFGYLLPNGLHMHLDKCFVLSWIGSEDMERYIQRSIQQRAAQVRKESKAPAPDHLYLIANERAGLVKIGVSTNPEYRMRQLQNTNGEPLTLVSTVQLLNAYVIEGRLHRKLERNRQRGEWFIDTPEVRDAFHGVTRNAEAA